ncbi:MAG: LL-diaminopimelate aminotransferase [Clostridia bacterium]|nr:LL-diaminopimelate aminotransferase [Clostridia bacterium]
MKINFNRNFSLLKPDYLFFAVSKAVGEFVKENPTKKVISLGIGDVTRPLAPCVVSAMKKAADEMEKEETFRGYPPPTGYPFLKKAIKNKYFSRGVSIDESEIFVSDGAKSDLSAITDVLGRNRAYIVDPVYPVYFDVNVLSGRRIKKIYANKENGFLPLPDKNEGRGVYYLCSPNNPTGTAYLHENLETWISFALKTGSLIIFDCAYEAFLPPSYPHSIYEIEGAKRCAVEINSFSKSAGFTGVRCGYTVVPQDVILMNERLNKLFLRRQTTKFNGVSYITQRGAEASLTDEGVRETAKTVLYYKENAKILSSFLKEKGIFFTGGEFSPYLWFSCPENMRSWDFFRRLLYSVQVVGTPGSGFGEQGEGFMRFTSFAKRENVEKAVERLSGIF